MQTRRKEQLATLALGTALLLLLCFKPYELWVVEEPPQHEPLSASSWWNSSWQYRQQINISNTAGNLTDYQVKIELNSSNVGEHFNWSNGGKDLRFVDSDDTTELQFYVDYVGDWKKYEENPIITRGDVGAWDEKAIYGNVPVVVGDMKYLYYSGAGDTAHPNHETSIGVANGTSWFSLEKNSANPVIDRSDWGLGGEDKGLAVFDIKNYSGKWYMYVTIINDTFDIGVFENDDISNVSGWTNLTLVLGGSGTEHCPYTILNPNNSSEIWMYYAKIPSGESTYRIWRAKADISDPTNFVDDTACNPVLSVSGVNVLYPYIEYNGSIYTLYYTRKVGSNYKIYKVTSTDPCSFDDANKELVVDLGASGSWDDHYTAVPRKSGDFLFYSARSTTYNTNLYHAIGIFYNDKKIIAFVLMNLTNGTNTIYMYYGNPDATSVSNASIFIENITISHAYLFDDGSAKDYVGGLDGTISGATNVDGKFGKAFSFDGNDYIEIDDGLELGKTKSICLWYKQSSYTEASKLVFKGDGGGNYMTIDFRNNHQRVIWDSSDNGGTQTYFEGDDDLSADTSWHHVCMVRTANGSGELRMYFDGSLENYASSTSYDINVNSSTQIGRRKTYEGTIDSYFNGIIDEVLFFEDVLSGTSIQNIFENYYYITGTSLLIRKYADPEPSVSSFGSEETAPAGYSMNLSFGPPGTTKFIFAACGPDFENATATPINQTDEYGIDLVCRENDGMGGTAKIQIKLSGPLNPGWTWYASNESDFSPNITLTTEWQDIIHGLHEGECAYVWHFANCSYVHERPGAYQIYRIVGE